MGQEEYEVLLWVLGDRLEQFHIVIGAALALSAIAVFSGRLLNRFLWYIDYKLDAGFWSETL
ncbi:MAG: hypothetical protein BMS9Abin36_1332 [Gammaproteobacteria bacterium]|nr:MAG: hypothetical protein BMS9Abin36_1332 [Gammaproteobacteria bacterium]